MVLSCQFHILGCFTVEETAPETHPVRVWVGPRLDKKNSILPAFRHYYDSSKTTTSIFTILRADEIGTVCGLWPERSEIQFPVGSKVFFSPPKGQHQVRGPTSLQFDGHL